MPFRKKFPISTSRKRTRPFQFPISKRGFTLVELLVGLGLLALTTGSALLFLTSVFRGSNQAAVITEVKQNGQSVLDSLERQIRDASDARQMQGAELPLGAVNGAVLTLPGVNRTLYAVCFATTPAANGWIGLANMQTGAAPSLSDYKSLTNNANLIEGVDVSVCSFSVVMASAGSSSPAIVSLNFTINQGILAPSRRDFLSNAQFRTTISLRRY